MYLKNYWSINGIKRCLSSGKDSNFNIKGTEKNLDITKIINKKIKNFVSSGFCVDRSW
jgi:hypothetical protein